MFIGFKNKEIRNGSSTLAVPPVWDTVDDVYPIALCLLEEVLDDRPTATYFATAAYAFHEAYAVFLFSHIRHADCWQLSRDDVYQWWDDAVSIPGVLPFSEWQALYCAQHGYADIWAFQYRVALGEQVQRYRRFAECLKITV